MFYGGSDRLLFTTQVGELAVKNVVSTQEETTIREAAQIMSEQCISSIVIRDRNGLPTGMVTDRDPPGKGRRRDGAGRSRSRAS